MGIAAFLVLALISAAVIIYPLLAGRGSPTPAKGVASTDEEIQRAVRDLRRARGRSGNFCPSCGSAYKANDRFCVYCGGELPLAAPSGPVCPACGAALHEGDLFCSKCGHSMTPEEAA